jgi:nitrile hydratase accessory protein
MTADPPAASAIPLAPANDDTRVFQEPWEARAFAITVALHKAGVFTWKDWAAALSQEIGKASCAGDPDTGETYYRHWLAALEQVVAEKGLADAAVLSLYREAWVRACERTPHGSPIELRPGDFEET